MLQFMPQYQPGSEAVFVFINNERGQNEECLAFNLCFDGNASKRSIHAEGLSSP